MSGRNGCICAKRRPRQTRAPPPGRPTLTSVGGARRRCRSRCWDPACPRVRRSAQGQREGQAKRARIAASRTGAVSGAECGSCPLDAAAHRRVPDRCVMLRAMAMRRFLGLGSGRARRTGRISAARAAETATVRGDHGRGFGARPGPAALPGGLRLPGQSRGPRRSVHDRRGDGLMERIVARSAACPRRRRVLVVEIAKQPGRHVRRHGGLPGHARVRRALNRRAAPRGGRGVLRGRRRRRRDHRPRRRRAGPDRERA